MRRIATCILCSALLVGCNQKEIKHSPPKTKPVQEVEVEVEQINIGTFQTNLETNMTSDSVQFQFAIANSSTIEARLLFPSAKQYDVIVKNSDGEIVYQAFSVEEYSKEPTSILLGPNKTNVWESTWKVDTSSLPKGKYIVEGTILATEINDEKLSSADMDELKATTIFEVEKKETIFSKNLHITKKDNGYKLTGIVDTYQELYYSVENGRNLLLKEMPMELTKGVDGMYVFDIQVSVTCENLLEDEVVSLNVYSKDVKGNVILLQKVVLE